MLTGCWAQSAIAGKTMNPERKICTARRKAITHPHSHPIISRLPEAGLQVLALNRREVLTAECTSEMPRRFFSIDSKIAFAILLG